MPMCSSMLLVVSLAVGLGSLVLECDMAMYRYDHTAGSDRQSDRR